MTRHALALLLIILLGAAVFFAACERDAGAGAPALRVTSQKSAQKLNEPFQPITPTATLTATITVTPTVATPTATVALPTATDDPTPSPAPTQPTACAVLTHWAAPPGSFAVIEARPFPAGGAWQPFMVIREQFPLPAVPLYDEYEYLISWPGPTTTIVPTPRDTRTPEPTQTPVYIVVTATPLPTGTAPPTAPPTATRAVLLPVVVRGFRRWEWWLP